MRLAATSVYFSMTSIWVLEEGGSYVYGIFPLAIKTFTTPLPPLANTATTYYLPPPSLPSQWPQCCLSVFHVRLTCIHCTPKFSLLPLTSFLSVYLFVKPVYSQLVFLPLPLVVLSASNYSSFLVLLVSYISFLLLHCYLLFMSSQILLCLLPENIFFYGTR